MLEKDDQPFCDIYGATSSSVLTEYLSPDDIIEASEEDLIERVINHLKTNMYIAEKNARNHATTKADVFLDGIASQLTVIAASRINCPEYIDNLLFL